VGEKENEIKEVASTWAARFGLVILVKVLFFSFSRCHELALNVI